MTTRTPLPAPPLHDAALWLIGAPAAALLAAYARAKAPALSADAPDQIIAVILACALGALIAWNLLWSAIAHAAAAGRAPGRCGAGRGGVVRRRARADGLAARRRGGRLRHGRARAARGLGLGRPAPHRVRGAGRGGASPPPPARAGPRDGARDLSHRNRSTVRALHAVDAVREPFRFSCVHAVLVS